ncbi:endonuclease/exonuclease/phosphatase family protein [Galbibacter sp. BG1]|uniref:endonuclease/exonuclease/phosphatase family protein n=1 Tax=Galbibacter sp. BG1 TaxID=1170699 RepID=UPI0021032F41|nr:endonuclease/exonuclease/phosphatase family protein [Galbibacter sp. BG1]
MLLKKWKWFDYLIICGLLSGLFINSFFLINYTSMVPVEVQWARDIKSSNGQFSILLSNVKMTNKKVKALLGVIEKKEPDLILMMEVDASWNKELKVLKNEYPYSQHTINEVAYGMVLFSKFPLKKVEVDYLTHKEVPSFESTVTLPNGKYISFHTLHPVPPTHFKDLPDNAGQQENALKKLGKRIEARKYPTVVAGDLNDVVWSYVDDLTETKNILYDVRVGRGFYNSFNAKNFLTRWPLDHVFVTEEFQLKKLERLPKIGSDHFPIYAELVLKNSNVTKNTN